MEMYFKAQFFKLTFELDLNQAGKSWGRERGTMRKIYTF